MLTTANNQLGNRQATTNNRQPTSNNQQQPTGDNLCCTLDQLEQKPVQ